MDKECRRIIEKARDGETLSEEEIDTLYCAVPQVMSERDAFENGLVLIARGGCSATDMQRIATLFLPPGISIQPTARHVSDPHADIIDAARRLVAELDAAGAILSDDSRPISVTVTDTVLRDLRKSVEQAG